MTTTRITKQGNEYNYISTSPVENKREAKERRQINRMSRWTANNSIIVNKIKARKEGAITVKSFELFVKIWNQSFKKYFDWKIVNIVEENEAIWIDENGKTYSKSAKSYAIYTEALKNSDDHIKDVFWMRFWNLKIQLDNNYDNYDLVSQRDYAVAKKEMRAHKLIGKTLGFMGAK